MPDDEGEAGAGRAVVPEHTQRLCSGRGPPPRRSPSCEASCISRERCWRFLGHLTSDRGAPGPHAAWTATYGATLILLLGVSGMYHTPQWSDAMRSLLRRVDHAAILLLIAGTYTPVCLVGLAPDTAHTVLWVVWAVTLFGVVVSLIWVKPPRALHVGLCIALGWCALPYASVFAVKSRENLHHPPPISTLRPLIPSPALHEWAPQHPALGQTTQPWVSQWG